MVKKIKVTVSEDRTYVIPRDIQEEFGFLPGKKIVYEEDGDKRVVGHVV